MDHCCPGNLTAVENRTICFRLGGTLENLLQMFNFYIVNLTGVNKSYLLRSGLIAQNQFWFAAFSGLRNEAGIYQQITASD